VVHTTPTAVQAPVRFLDLEPSHAPLKEAILADVAAVIDSGAFVNGPAVAAFEEAFAAYCGTRESVGLASGLDALRLALLALGIEPGDEVLVPAQTFVATFEAVSQAGGVPVPVDVSDADYGLDAAAAEAAVNARTRFVLPVHLYGQLADVAAIDALCARHDLLLLEDACQAHGAERDGRRAGTIGAAAAFSFYPGKNLGAMGDAGALTTDDEQLAHRMKALREHGQAAKYHHEVPGYTARLDTIQAAVLLRKLPLLDGWNRERREAAAFYGEALDGVGDLHLPPVAPGSDPVWHLYVVRTSRPAELAAFLAARGIGTGRHYPEPPHLSAAYGDLGYGAGTFPVAEALAREALSLPIFPGIAEHQLEAVALGVRAFYAGG
jgi:dTDP-4-amino-4,6-dideoxygalactose transaminase